MEITRKTDYALRMLADLIRHPDEILSVRVASEDNGVPYSFARSIQHDLVRAGIIGSVRGSHGGMRLAIDPSSTTLLHVVEAVQGPISVSERNDPAEGGAAHYPFDDVFCHANELLRDYLASVTLADAVLDGDAEDGGEPET